MAILFLRTSITFLCSYIHNGDTAQLTNKVEQSRHQVLRAYCPNLYTVIITYKNIETKDNIFFLFQLHGSTGTSVILDRVSLRAKRTFTCEVSTYPELYIPSTLNIDLILWHTQLNVCA